MSDAPVQVHPLRETRRPLLREMQFHGDPVRDVFLAEPKRDLVDRGNIRRGDHVLRRHVAVYGELPLPRLINGMLRAACEARLPPSSLRSRETVRAGLP